MSIAYWCVLLAALLPYFFTTLAKSRKDFDNKNPRIYLDRLMGWRQRAHWTQINGFEAFPAFACGVIIATLQQASPFAIDVLAVIFVIACILYGIFYLGDQDKLRTSVWGIGFLSMVSLYLLAAKIF